MTYLGKLCTPPSLPRRSSLLHTPTTATVVTMSSRTRLAPSACGARLTCQIDQASTHHALSRADQVRHGTDKVSRAPVTSAEYEEGVASQKQAQNTKPNAARDEEWQASASTVREQPASAKTLVTRLTACNADTPKNDVLSPPNPDSRPTRQCMRIEKLAKFDFVNTAAWLIKLEMQDLCLPAVSYTIGSFTRKERSSDHRERLPNLSIPRTASKFRTSQTRKSPWNILR